MMLIRLKCSRIFIFIAEQLLIHIGTRKDLKRHNTTGQHTCQQNRHFCSRFDDSKRQNLDAFALVAALTRATGSYKVPFMRIL